MSVVNKPTLLQEKLAQAREVTKLTGGLHDIQVHQLKLWPFCVVPHAEKSSFVWDPDAKTVEFTVTLGKERPPSGWKEKLPMLETWVRTLLGKEWSILIKTSSGDTFYPVKAVKKPSKSKGRKKKK